MILSSNVWAILMPCFVPFSRLIGVCWHNLAPFGSGLGCAQLENGYILGPEQVKLNHDSEGTVFLCHSPLLVVSTRQSGPKSPLDVVFACCMHVLWRFVLATYEMGLKLVKNNFSTHDLGPLRVLVDVF